MKTCMALVWVFSKLFGGQEDDLAYLASHLFLVSSLDGGTFIFSSASRTIITFHSTVLCF